MRQESIPAVLLLQDGTLFYGQSCGAKGTTTGEIAFNTAMTGYQEVFTDPSYFGQCLVMATSHIGNYGVYADEIESGRCQVSGIIIKKFSDVASRVGGAGTLQDYLVRDHVVGICDLDTRALVRHIRKNGAMNCIISSDNLDVEALKAQLAKVPSMDGLELASTVSTKEIYELGDTSSKLKVSVLDFGVKEHILQCLVDRGAHVRVHPAKTDFATLKAFNPTGYFLSNGPGDPAPWIMRLKRLKKF